MSLLTDVEKIQGKSVAIILGVVGAIAPGIAMIFAVNRQLFLSLDVLKLSVLSISFTLPLIIIWFFLSASTVLIPMNEKESDDFKPEAALAISVSVVNVIFYSMVLISTFVHLSMKSFMYCSLLSSAGLWSISLSVAFFVRRSRNKKKPSTGVA